MKLGRKKGSIKNGVKWQLIVRRKMKKSKKTPTVWTKSWDTTCTWESCDMYAVVVPCVNRFKTAFNVLLKGKIKLAWQVPVGNKDKRLIISGKKEKNEFTLENPSVDDIHK